MNVPGAKPETRCFIEGADGAAPMAPDEAARLVRSRIEDPPDVEAELVWLDLTAPTEAEADFLRNVVGLHPLAVEDCLRGRQRPKLDRYPGYFFIVFYSARINPTRARMALNEIHIFVGSGFIITVHNQPIAEVDAVLESLQQNPARRSRTAALAHRLLDAIVDHYFPLIEYFSGRIELFEDQIFMQMPDLPMQRVSELRQELIHFRRVLAPQRDVLSSLVRRDLPFVSPEMVPYFQDVHDHVLRATEEVDAFRDLLAGLLDIQTSNTARQLNQTMRTLTVWSIILMSMTLVAGIYGMNFMNMPELAWPFGYYLALALMLLAGGSLLLIFRRRRWL